MVRTFRFGLQVGGRRDRFESLLRKAEDTGFDLITSADHIGKSNAAFSMLAMAAQMTGLRVSPMVIANDYRHPVITAKETATIDILSNGRAELGIGTGWIKEQYEMAGLAYDSPRVRVDRFEEAIQVIKGCWSGEPFTFIGDHYQVKDLTGPEPEQRPYPPLLIAGAGPRMLGIAGREADIVGIAPLRRGDTGFDTFDHAVATSGDRIEEQILWIREEAGARFDEIELNVFSHHVEVVADVEVTANRLADEFGATPKQVLASPHMLVGSVDRIVDTLIMRRELYGFSYVVFGAWDLDSVIPVVERLAGT